MITRDNVSLKVNAVIYFRVMDPNNAIIEVENYLFPTSQLALTTLLLTICIGYFYQRKENKAQKI